MTRKSGFISVEMEIYVRKYDVDKTRLMKCLADHRKIPLSRIAELLDKPKTMVEHWFRQDRYFAIPDAEDWFMLKDLLGIKTNEFDESITTFEYKGGCFDMANRIYVGDVAPTLTAGCEKTLFCLETDETEDVQPDQPERNLQRRRCISKHHRVWRLLWRGKRDSRHLYYTDVVGALCATDYKWVQ